MRYIAILEVDCPIGRIPERRTWQRLDLSKARPADGPTCQRPDSPKARLADGPTCQRPDSPKARLADGPTCRFPNAGIADCQMVKPPNVVMSNCPNGRFSTDQLLELSDAECSNLAFRKLVNLELDIRSAISQFACSQFRSLRLHSSWVQGSTISRSWRSGV